MTINALFETRHDTPADKALMILGLARMGAAGSDSTLAINLNNGGYRETFEAIATAASDTYCMICEAEMTPSKLPDAPAALFKEWQGVRERWIAAAAALAPKDAEGAALEALSDQAEAFCKRIVDSTPTTLEDCAAMIEWVLLDGEGGLLDPSHSVVQRKVADALAGMAK